MIAPLLPSTAAMLRSFGAPSQFGPFHGPHLPPGDSCPAPQSRRSVSSAQTAERPSFCSHPVTSMKRDFWGVSGKAAHPLKLPAGRTE
jgi:hypothetical protein